MIKGTKNNRNGGFLWVILMVIIVILIVYYFKDNPTGVSFWNTFTDNWERMKDGGPNDWQLAAPVIDLSTVDWH